MRRITDWAHDALRAHLRPGDWALDATLGNGHDAQLLAACVGPAGRVWGLDVQPRALDAAAERLAPFACFTALLADHARLAEHLPAEARGRLRAAVFNLGWLPGGDHARTTTREGTLAALASAADWLAGDGVLSCTCYPGHDEGAREARAVEDWFASASAPPARLTRIGLVATRRPAPFLLWLEPGGEA